MEKKKSVVKVYTTQTCPYCTMAKNFLKENGVGFVEKNVAEDRAAAVEMVEKSGQMGVPVLDINGDIIIGFDRNAIKKSLNLEE
jgi:glutaredoxin 3